MSRHIGQDWRKKVLKDVLIQRVRQERNMRDEFIHHLSLAVTHSADRPVAACVPHNEMVRRKMATFRYNQWGMEMKNSVNGLTNRCHKSGVVGAYGTREWVPFVNVHQWAFTKMVKSGHVLVHRVHRKGYGTDPTLQRGGWQHRWNKTLQKNVMEYSKV